jgi:hypothetical protein
MYSAYPLACLSLWVSLHHIHIYLAFLLACLYQASLYQTAHLSIFLKSLHPSNSFTWKKLALISIVFSFQTDVVYMENTNLLSDGIGTENLAPPDILQLSKYLAMI